MEDTATRPGAPSARAALGLAAWVAGGLLALRLALLWALDHLLREQEQAVTLWRLAKGLAPEALHAALAGAALGLAWAWRARARRGGWLADGLALVACAALVASALGGWPHAEPGHVPSPDTLRGKAAVAGFLLAGLALGGAVALARRAPRWNARAARLLGSGLVLLLGLALALGGPLAFRARFGRVSDVRTVRTVVRDVAFDEAYYEVRAQHPRQPPGHVVLTPSLDYRVDGGDLPALLMAPPCEVAFTVQPTDGACRLQAAAGVDLDAARLLPPERESFAIRFEVLVDGARRFDETVTIRRQQDAEERAWRHVGGKRGLALEPGNEVVLRTTLVDPPDLAPERTPVLRAGFGLLALVEEVERRREPATPARPNIVLVLMDTLRADRMSCYGYELETTPALDGLAARGLLFENAYATSSWTWPSTASVLTGLAPETHGVLDDGSCYLSGAVEALPALLEDGGYTTGAISCNPLIVPSKNFDRGFEYFDSLHTFRKSGQVIDKTLDWIEMHAGSRFFLYLHLADTHAHYEPTPEALAAVGGQAPPDYPERGIVDYHKKLLTGVGFDERGEPDPARAVPPEHADWMRRSYDAAVITADHYVGEVLAQLAELGLDDRTVVAFTSDHGEELLDHGLVTHGNTLHRELVRIPLILAGPGVPAGERVETIVSNRQLAPTLARFGGTSFQELEDAQSLFEPEALAPETVFFSTHHGWWNGRHRLRIYGLRSGRWVLHWAPKGAPWGAEGDAPPEGEVRLYDVSADPQELRDVAAEHPEVVAELKETLRAHVTAAVGARRSTALGAGSGDRALLEHLGYVQEEEVSPPHDGGGEDGAERERAERERAERDARRKAPGDPPR